jgi:AcrR family transcriptional regulator
VAKREGGGARVDEVIDVGLQLFLERGYDNTPLSAIAERLGLTKAGLYHHFESKEDLLFMAHLRTMERQLLPLIVKAEAERDPEQRLRVFIYDHARTLALEPTAGLLIREARRLAPAHLAEIKKTWRRGLKLLSDSIAELQSLGRCRTDVRPTHAAFAAIGMTNWISFWFDSKRPDSADEVARAMLVLFMDGLTQRPTGQAADLDRDDNREAGIARRRE